MSTPNQHQNVHSIQTSRSPRDACTHQTTGNTRVWLTTAISPLLADCTRTTSGPLDVNIRRTNTGSLFVGPVVAARSCPPLGIHWPTRGEVRLCTQQASRHVNASTSFLGWTYEMRSDQCWWPSTFILPILGKWKWLQSVSRRVTLLYLQHGDSLDMFHRD